MAVMDLQLVKISVDSSGKLKLTEGKSAQLTEPNFYHG